MSNELTQERLKEVLHYDPETGLFTNLTQRANCVKIGALAGSIHHEGYISIRIDGFSYGAHRLVWLYVYGDFPKNQIDHINQVKDDNRIVNLREANSSANKQNVGLQKNNSSGYKGVTFNKKSGKWVVQLKINGKNMYFGHYCDLKEAVIARKQAETTHHPFSPKEIIQC